MSEWQKCPICNGTGIVSGGFFDHAGEGQTWASNHATDTCRRCDGTGTIETPNGLDFSKGE